MKSKKELLWWYKTLGSARGGGQYKLYHPSEIRAMEYIDSWRWAIHTMLPRKIRRWLWKRYVTDGWKR